MEFPAFTICPGFSNAFKYDILKRDKLTPSDLRKFNYPKYVDSATYLKEVCYNIFEVIKNISVTVQENLSENDSTEFILFSSNNIKVMNYTDQFYHHFGRCYTFQIPSFFHKLLVNIPMFPVILFRATILMN